MKTKANGIAINYQVDGPDDAPWLIFSNSLATNLATAAPRRPPVATPSSS
jgi:3-oxoadipate enol-lactonase